MHQGRGSHDGWQQQWQRKEGRHTVPSQPCLTNIAILSSRKRLTLLTTVHQLGLVALHLNGCVQYVVTCTNESLGVTQHHFRICVGSYREARNKNITVYCMITIWQEEMPDHSYAINNFTNIVFCILFKTKQALPIARWTDKAFLSRVSAQIWSEWTILTPGRAERLEHTAA